MIENIHEKIRFSLIFCSFFKKIANFLFFFPLKSSLDVEPRAFRAWQKPLELEPGIEPSLGSFHPYRSSITELPGKSGTKSTRTRTKSWAEERHFIRRNSKYIGFGIRQMLSSSSGYMNRF